MAELARQIGATRRKAWPRWKIMSPVTTPGTRLSGFGAQETIDERTIATVTLKSGDISATNYKHVGTWSSPTPCRTSRVVARVTN